MKITTNGVRATIAVLFTTAIVVGFFAGKTPPEIFFSFAGSAITYYFMSPANGGPQESTNASKHMRQLSSIVNKLGPHTVIEPVIQDDK